MKKALIISTLLMLISAATLLAQPQRGAMNGMPGVQSLVVQYGDQLELTDEQISDLIALRVERMGQFQGLRGNMQRGNRGNRGNINRPNRPNAGRGAGPGYAYVDEMQEDILEILTDEQTSTLRDLMMERASRSHEFRTRIHDYAIRQSEIEGQKADQVSDMLNRMSTHRMQMAQQQISNPDADVSDLWNEHRDLMDETYDSLSELLTVSEFQSLRENLGMGWNRNVPRGAKRLNRGQRW
jgi:hypothetical protein